MPDLAHPDPGSDHRARLDAPSPGRLPQRNAHSACDAGNPFGLDAMKIVLKGLPQRFDLGAWRDRMPTFGPVIGVQPMRGCRPDQLMTIGDMAPGAAKATKVARRVDGIHPIGRFHQARVMHHD